MPRKSVASFIALVALAGVVALAATPSSGQTPEQEVVEVSGGAAGVFAEARSDIFVPPSPDEIRAILEAAAANDQDGIEGALAAAGVADPATVSASNAEAVLAGVGPVPEVTIPPTGGGPFSDSAANVDFDGVPIAQLAEVDAEGALGPDGFAAATSSLATYDLLGLLGGAAVTTECLADLEGTTGSTELVDAGGIISGPFDTNPAPNSLSPFNIDLTFVIDPTSGTTFTIEYRTILNEQITNGTELTVNGLHTFLSIRIDPEGPGAGDPELVFFEIEAIASQSRCGVVAADVVEPSEPTPTPGPVPAAPTFAG